MALLSRKIELCREYIEVYTILEPGLTKWKGRVRYFTVIFSFCIIVCICNVICSPLTPKSSVLLFVFAMLNVTIDAKTFCIIVCICYVICSPLTPKRSVLLFVFAMLNVDH